MQRLTGISLAFRRISPKPWSKLTSPKMTSSLSTVAQNPLPATFLRGGTSKGIFLNKAALPSDPDEWNQIFLGIMGSPDPDYGRQLDGMGGGISSLSKICVISAPTAEHKAKGIQVEYTFVQVGIRDSSIDLSGNCGNLSCMVGAYAVDEGIVPRSEEADQMTVRSFNTNTQKIIDTTFPVSPMGNPLLTLPQASMGGVPGKASQIIMEFVNPAGARTGKLLPTGQPIDLLEIPVPRIGSDSVLNHQIKASLVDATNPTVFVEYTELDQFLPMDAYVQGKGDATEEVTPILEAIRKQGAIRMGLDPSAQAQPKIAILSVPGTESDREQKVDIAIHALSMGVLHKALPMTVGLCLGVAAKTKDTLAWEIMKKFQSSSSQQPSSSSTTPVDQHPLIRIRHPGGLVDVGANFGEDGQPQSAKVVRTGRFLMKGVVWW